MKLRSYRILYRVFCTLSDKTNGFPLFVKYKILLGTLIMGMVAASCSNRKPQITCYDISISPDPVIKCYLPADINITREDIRRVSQDTLTPAKVTPEDMISCYKIAVDVSEKKAEVQADSIIIEDVIEVEHIGRPTTCYKPVIIKDPHLEIAALLGILQYHVVEQKPTFQGGNLKKFTDWVENQINSEKRDIKGEIQVTFRVDSVGIVNSVVVNKGIEKQLDEEVVRIIESSPAWKPGKNKEVNVTTIVNVSINIYQEQKKQ